MMNMSEDELSKDQGRAEEADELMKAEIIFDGQVDAKYSANDDEERSHRVIKTVQPHTLHDAEAEHA